jgi:Rps23 Pro-64 3,4-dihydroxylase Tpa1-like proline 4-hydroxylase
MNIKLKKNNYLILPNFINKFRAKELGREFKIFSENENVPGDVAAPNSRALYNYISFLELLCEKTPEISHILEETVLPTYCYSRVYSNGDILERHSDRKECEISLTLHLDSDKSWPIYIVDPKGNEKKVNLNPGDAMMYLGCDADHWRHQYDGQYYTQVFLHYVRSRGPYGTSYFDMDITTKDENVRVNKSFFLNPSEPFEENIQKDIKTNDEVVVSDEDNGNLEKSKNSILKNKEPLMPSPSNTLEQYIHVFNNIIPDELCDEIINEFANSSEWQDAEVADLNNPVNKSARNCKNILMSDLEVIGRNQEYRKNLDMRIYESVKNAMIKYHDMHNDFGIEIDTGYQLLKYETGGFYVEHVDSFRKEQRSVSCAMILNDDYEGGEFAFFNRQVMIKSRKGSVIMFPSNFMFPHEVMPVTEGTRYSIITWLV